MNTRSLLLVLAASALVLLALISRVGAVLALAIPILTFLLVALWGSAGKPDLSIARSFDRQHAFAGERLHVKVVITNHGDRIARLSISDELPEAARLVGGHSARTFALGAGASSELTYSLRMERGLCTWEAFDVIASDPLGLFEEHLRLPAPAEIIVRPAPQGDVRLPLRPARTLRGPGPIPIPLAGAGTDFLGVREYRPGDPRRHINWRLAARHPGQLFTNEHERHEVADIGLILDARFAGREIFERAVGSAASLAEGILREGNRLSLLVFGRAMDAVYPGYGKRQLSLILRTLAAASPSPNIPFEYLDYFPRRLFPIGSVLVVISAVGPADVQTYAELRASGFDLILISPEPLYDTRLADQPLPHSDLAARIARIERRSALLSLSKLGAIVVDWPTDQPLERILRQSLLQRRHTRKPAS